MGSIPTKTRKALATDCVEILSILKAVAADIQLTMVEADDDDWVADIQSYCNGVDGNVALVSVDDCGELVGFALAAHFEPGTDFYQSCYRAVDCFDDVAHMRITYIGVKPGYTGAGRFRGMLEQLTALGQPLVAVVKHNNRSAMAERLMKFGFKKSETPVQDDEDVFHLNFRGLGLD